MDRLELIAYSFMENTDIFYLYNQYLINDQTYIIKCSFDNLYLQNSKCSFSVIIVPSKSSNLYLIKF